MLMLPLNPESVCNLISHARLFHSKEGLVLPDVPDSPADDWGLEALETHEHDSAFTEFKNTLTDLEPDQQQAVVALMWLGRGEFAVDEWDMALEAARESWTENTAEYLIAHPQLADFLLEGLDLLGYDCET
ncbi:MAG: DUF3775 domain-containing protein [Thiogranum sp.]|nr:DUF3775 domain-containing protein [Thiogranum sp.]